MTRFRVVTPLNAGLLSVSLVALTACVGGGPFDGDFRRFGTAGFDTSAAALNATAARPAPDQRGVISYPGYQVAVARRGDTVESVAARVGLPAQDIAAHNALPPGAVLRDGEVLALPRRVGEGPVIASGPSIPTVPGTAPATGSGGTIAVTSLAGAAIDRAATTTPPAAKPVAAPATAPKPAAGPEPARHKVVRGDSAYSIARLYNVNVKALADWNGLGPDLAVREGQILLIPVGASAPQETVDTTSLPGEGSKTPTPPSAGKPLPKETTPTAAEPVKTPPAPDLGTTKAAGKFAMPVAGKIIRGYQKKKNDGIDIAAAAGTGVQAAGDGTVAAITKDTEQVPILVIRHEGNLLTVYANLDGIAVKKGDKVTRGQTIAKVRASDPAFLHFEVRQGFESVDPMPYLQ